MEDKTIFDQLFEAATHSKDPKGVVTSCVVDGGQVIAIAASSDDGKEHAENVMLGKMSSVPMGAVLYCTLEPCSRRTDPTMRDCVSDIIKSGIKEVVFGARDPKQSELTHKRLGEAGVSIRQVTDAEIIKKCAEIFNESVSSDHAGVDVDLKPIQ